jgi:hypothetical protein
MCPADRLHTGLGEAEVSDLPFLNQRLDRSRDVFDRDVRVDPVLIEEIDPIRLTNRASPNPMGLDNFVARR